MCNECLITEIDRRRSTRDRIKTRVRIDWSRYLARHYFHNGTGVLGPEEAAELCAQYTHKAIRDAVKDGIKKSQNEGLIVSTGNNLKMEPDGAQTKVKPECTFKYEFQGQNIGVVEVDPLTNTYRIKINSPAESSVNYKDRCLEEVQKKISLLRGDRNGARELLQLRLYAKRLRQLAGCRTLADLECAFYRLGWGELVLKPE